MSKNTADEFHIGRRSYSKLALEKMAESITRKPNESGFSVAQINIERIFWGEARTESDLHMRLVLTRYFLDNDRQLIPEMVQILSSGITDFLGGRTAWPLPSVDAGNSPDELILMLAIDEVFKRKGPDIAEAITSKRTHEPLSLDALKKRREKARELLKNDESASYLLLMLKHGLKGLKDPESGKVLLRRYNLSEALELLENPRMGEQFIKETTHFFHR